MESRKVLKNNLDVINQYTFKQLKDDAFSIPRLITHLQHKSKLITKFQHLRSFSVEIL